jgi:threonine dehydrogenase-like Zn-dependent dehydrogenase
LRALVLEDKKVTLRTDYPTPDPDHLRAGEVLVQVRQAGICNTDLELIKGYAGFQGVLGHEFVGVVAASPTVPEWLHRRVVGEINVGCGICPVCRSGKEMHCPTRAAVGIRGRDGAFAQYLTLPAANLVAVPDDVSDDQAVFTEPLAAALSITNRVHIRPDDRVVLLGDGKLGQLIAQVLALNGCDLLVVGRHQEKLRLLTERGINTTCDAPTILHSGSADIVVEATGTPAGFATAQKLVRARGKLVLKSTHHAPTSSDLSTIVVNELHIVGSRCGPFAAALRLLERGWVKVEPLIHARFALEDGVAAMERAAQRGVMKVLLTMGNSGERKKSTSALRL